MLGGPGAAHKCGPRFVQFLRISTFMVLMIMQLEDFEKLGKVWLAMIPEILKEVGVE